MRKEATGDFQPPLFLCEADVGIIIDFDKRAFKMKNFNIFAVCRNIQINYNQ